MYKNMNRYINRADDDKKLQGSIGRLFGRNENVNELENFVNPDEYSRNRYDCEINDLHKCVKFKNEGPAIKIVFLVLGDINLPGCPPPPPPPPPSPSSSGSKPSNEDEFEILLDSEGNVLVNGKKLEAKVLEDGSSIFTINVNSEKKTHNEENHEDKKANNEENNTEKKNNNEENNTEKKNNNEEKHVEKEAHNKEKHTEKKTSIEKKDTEKIVTTEQNQPTVKQ